MKKLNKFFAILVALAMMATLCVSMAFAEDVTQSASVKDAVLTKDFQVPEGVTSPVANFKFKFDLQSAPTSAATAADDFDVSIPFSTQGSGDQLGIKYLKAADVFDYSDTGIITAKTGQRLTQPGEYVYRVTEYGLVENGSSFTPVNANATENIAMDTATVYTLRVYVVRDGNNLKVQYITVQKGDPVTTGTDEENKAANNAAKVDPDNKIDDNDTPNDTTDDKDLGSAFRFTNTYSKTLANDPSDDDPDDPATSAAVAIKKVVTGSGDTAYAFPFTATMTIPDEMKKDTAQTFDATLPDGTTVTFHFAANATTSAETTDSGKVEFALKNGEALKFATFPAGAKLTINETVTGAQYGNNYNGSIDGYGLVANTDTYSNGAGIVNKTTNPVNAQGKVTVTNNLESSAITPTGILINNLPYIALALVAIGGLVAYVVVRRRQDDEA